MNVFEGLFSSKLARFYDFEKKFEKIENFEMRF